MKRNLVFKLLICYFVTAISLLALLNTFGTCSLKSHITSAKELLLYDEASLIANKYTQNLYKDDITITNLKTQLESIDTFLNTRIWIVSTTGKILCDSFTSDTTNTQGQNINDFDSNFLNHKFSRNTTIDTLLTDPSLSVVYPIPLNYQLHGYVVIHLPQHVIEQECILYINILNICLLLFLIVLMLVFLYIFLMTALPLHKLRKACMEYASGHFDYNISVRGNDEFSDLSNALNYMAGELGSMDEYQKKFVANISHDFRSPLTSIKGYAEAILDGTIPTELQGKYLNVIVFETERLNKLTNNLLELNSFDTNRNLLDITTFDINYIIKQTATTFEGICTKKKVQLNLVFPSKELFVDADISKIQQVLYNLIDNAVKFSPSNSTIKLSTNVKGDKVFVSVKDFGSGIPKDSIKKIWDRFYKTDSSRGKDKKGTGLGLSITKEIILAHNENIDVISTEGVGTEFTFSLSKTEE